MPALRLSLLLLAGLLLAMAASLQVGLRVYGPGTVWAGLAGDAGADVDALIVATLRVPRTLVAAVSGAALGLSGLLMQATTRNPLAEPGLLGVNAGAALAAVIAVTGFGASGLGALSAVALLGAALAVLAVFSLSMLGGGRAGPPSVLLAGVTLAAMCASVTQVILISDESALETLLFWLSGSFADRPLSLLRLGGPMLAVGVLGALMLAPSLDAMRADDDSAEALGVQVTRARLFALGLAAALAGGSVALAGPVPFIGLVAPHIARRLCPGGGHVGLVFGCLLTGALTAVVADIAARIVVAPGEAPVGTVLALVGVPALVVLLRRGRGAPA